MAGEALSELFAWGLSFTLDRDCANLADARLGNVDVLLLLDGESLGLEASFEENRIISISFKTIENHHNLVPALVAADFRPMMAILIDVKETPYRSNNNMSIELSRFCKRRNLSLAKGSQMSWLQVTNSTRNRESNGSGTRRGEARRS